MKDVKQQRAKRTNKLFILTVISILCNINFAYFFWYEWNQGLTPLIVKCAFAPKHTSEEPIEEFTNISFEEEISTLMKSDFQSLLNMLHDRRFIQDGIQVRDLALSILFSCHYLDVERALNSLLHKRLLVFTLPAIHQTIKLPFFHIYADEKFEQICEFVAKEQWPFTTKGLFHYLKKQKNDKVQFDDNLVDVFSHTSEFLFVEAFLCQNKTIAQSDLMEVLLDGDFTILQQFIDEQKKARDMSQKKVREFLITYIKRKSKKAAELLIEIEPKFAVHELSDMLVCDVLELLSTENIVLAKKYAHILLTSLRDDKVIISAAQIMLGADANTYDFKKMSREEVIAAATKVNFKNRPEQNSLIQKNDDKTNSSRQAVIPSSSKEEAQVREPSYVKRYVEHPKEILYVVRQGDTLWRLAKQYQVEIDAIRRMNHLKSDALQPGTVLRIPQPSR